MKKEQIAKLAKDLAKTPKEQGNYHVIKVETITDLYMLTKELYRLGFECTFAFGEQKEPAVGIFLEKVKQPKKPVQKPQPTSQSSPPNK